MSPRRIRSHPRSFTKRTHPCNPLDCWVRSRLSAPVRGSLSWSRRKALTLIQFIRKLLVLVTLPTIAYAAPVHLRCEYLENPLGIDVAAPRLFWQSDNTER